MTQDEWGCQVSENGISAHFSRARTLQQQQQQLSGTDAHNNKFENHVDNVVFHGVDPIVFCRIKSAPYPHVLLSARLVDFQRFHLFSSVVVKRGCPIEFVIQPILRSKLVVNDDDDDNSNKNNEKVVWTDRVGLELYGSTVTRDSPVPTTVLMNLNRLTPSLRAGFELGWSGSSVSNAGLSVNYRKVWSQKAGCQVDWTLRQTYLGQTDLYMLNQLSPRLITAAHFCYNSTNYSSQYGLGLIWNVMEKRKAENHSQITSSTVGVRWSSEKGWGIRWNADIGEHATAGISLGGLSLDGGNALDDMKIGIHFKGSF